MNKPVFHKKETGTPASNSPAALRSKVSWFKRPSVKRAVTLFVPFALLSGAMLAFDGKDEPVKTTTKCSNAAQELRLHLGEAEAIDERLRSTVRMATFTEGLWTGERMEKLKDSINTQMVQRAKVNSIIREKWAAWKSCSEGL